MAVATIITVIYPSALDASPIKIGAIILIPKTPSNNVMPLIELSEFLSAGSSVITGSILFNEMSIIGKIMPINK